MPDKPNEELLSRWYQQFSTDHDEQKRLMLSRLHSGTDSSEENAVMLDSWFERFSSEHESLKEDLLVRLAEIDQNESSFDEADPAIEDWYNQFGDNHSSLRDELLGGLPSPLPATTSKQARKKSWVSNRWLQLAASLLVLATAGIFLVNVSAKPAYAFEDVLNSVRSARRIYISGTGFARWGREKGNPTEKIDYYIERPDKFWVYRVNSFYDKDRLVTHRTTGFSTSNGSVRKKAAYPQSSDFKPEEHFEEFLTLDHPVWSQIEAEHYRLMVGALYFDQAIGDYKFKGRAIHKERKCFVYEQRIDRSVKRIFVALDAPIPIAATESRLQGKNSPHPGEELLMWEVDSIKFEPTSIPSHIQLPSEAERSSADAIPALVDRFSFSKLGWNAEDPMEVHVPFFLNAGRGVVVCWGKRERPEFHSELDGELSVSDPRFTVLDSNGESVVSHAIELGTTNDGTTDWNWIYVAPPSNEKSRRIGWQVVRYRSKRKHLLERDLNPIDIGEDGLRAAIRTAASDDDSANAIWLRLQEAQQEIALSPQA